MRCRITVLGRFLGLLLTLAACSPKVVVDFDKEATFSKYHSYSWGPGTPAKNPLVDRRIVTAIDSELAGKGLQKTENNPDLIVSYHAALTEDVTYSTTSVGIGYGPAWGPGYGWYGRGMGWGVSSGTALTTPSKIKVGTLNVDIHDAKTNQMIWRGSGSDSVSDDPEKNTEKIREAAAAMFEKYPPK